MITKKAFFLLFISLFLTPMFSLLPAEKTRTVKVACYNKDGFLEYNPTNKSYSGYAYEFLMAIKQTSAWEFEFINAESLLQALEMVRDGKVDLVAGVKPDQAKNYNCIPSYRILLGTSKSIFALADSERLSFENYKTFDGIKIGYIVEAENDNKIEEELRLYAQKHNFTATFLSFTSEKACETALKTGAINAILKDENTRTAFQKIADFSFEELYFAVNAQNVKLKEELDAIMGKIIRYYPSFYYDLKKKYYTIGSYTNLAFSDEENDFIKNQKQLNVAVLNRSTYFMAFRELYEKISEITGLKFNFINYFSYEEALEAFETGQCDIIFEMPQDYLYAANHKATLTSTILPINIFAIHNNTSIGKNTLAFRPTCAIVMGSYNEYIAKKIYSNRYTYLKCANPIECMDAVLSGRADTTLLNNFLTAIFRSDSRYSDLNYTMLPDFSYEITAGIREDLDYRIGEIISKGLYKLGRTSISEIFNNGRSVPLTITPSLIFYKAPLASVLTIVCLTGILIALLTSLYFTRQLRIKNKELMKAFSAKTDFMNKMSHDIRTPLNGILGMTYLAKEENDENKKKGYLEKIDLSGRYLLNLVNDILDMNKISSEKFTLKSDRYSPNEFYAYIYAIINPLAAKKKIKFSVEPFESNEAFFVDSLHFNQLFINLLSNAIKYTNEGGKVSFYCKNVVTTGHIFTGDFVVEDNGIGMSKEFQEHMFESFTQEKQTSTEMGTGLGLAIVKQIVTLMRGTITVESKIAEGSKFTVRLTFPLIPNEGKESQGENQSISLEGLHVLVCEDNAINAEIAGELLKKKGLIADFACNGKEGLEAFKNSQPWYYFAILMDIRMPVMDGFEAAKEIHALKRQDATLIPIIALTADAYIQDKERIIKSGMNAHITKPIEPEELYKSLESFAKKRII